MPLILLMWPSRLVIKAHLLHGLEGDASDKVIDGTATGLKRFLHLFDRLLFTEATLANWIDTVVWLIHAAGRGSLGQVVFDAWEANWAA